MLHWMETIRHWTSSHTGWILVHNGLRVTLDGSHPTLDFSVHFIETDIIWTDIILQGPSLYICTDV